MKILVVHNAYCREGGEDSVVDSEITALRARGHEVVRYQRSNREFSSMPVFVKALFLVGGYFFSRKTVREVSALIEQEQPDVVHVHNIFYLVSASVFAACRKYSVAVVQTLHNYRYLCPNALLYRDGRPCELCLNGNFFCAAVFRCRDGSFLQSLWAAVWVVWLRKSGALRGVCRFIALSEFSRGRFRAGGLDARLISVKSNFVRPFGERGEPGSFVLYAGALADYKGVGDLMRIIEASAGIPFVIAGRGPKEAELRSWIASRGLHAQVDLRGQVSASVLGELFSGCSLLLVTSRCYENFPRVIVEAFSQGVPVVVPDTPVMREIVAEGTGLFYRGVEDAPEIVRELFEGKERNRAFGEKAKQLYRSRYTEERNMGILESIYREAAGQEAFVAS